MSSNQFKAISFIMLAGLPAMLRIALQAGLLWLGVLMSHAATYYVATNGPGGGATNWATATNNIQDAISLCSSGDVVLVSNGVYETGGVTNWPAGSLLTNRVALTNAYITLRSANNDPTNTIIKGAWDPVTTNGPAAVRCVYMTNNTALIGFTLTNGATLWTTGANDDRHGGGVWGTPFYTKLVISNCIITGNSAATNGGGAYRATLYNCTLTGNRAAGLGFGGGAYAVTMTNCTLTGNSAGYGGGVYGVSFLNNCLLIDNTASVYGGGAALTSLGILSNCALIGNRAPNYGGLSSGSMYNSTVISNTATSTGGGAGNAASIYNCLLTHNSAPKGGGAEDRCKLYNCTVVSNSATIWGGGVSTSTVTDCIVYFNTAPSGSNWYDMRGATNSCTAPYPGGVGNITDNPMFADMNTANYRLNANSPCINTGTNMSWMTNSYDLDGRTRIRYGTVDMGAYETLYRGTICSFH